MATPDEPAEQRIVVAVDASAASLLALELAADLAAALRTSLAGLYVEEEDLLHAAGLPFVREVRSRSGQVAPFTADDVERHWRAVAREAHQALRRAAHTRQITCTFEVVRGRAAQAMSQAARSARLAGLGSGTLAAGRLGSVARAALGAAESSLLLVPPRRRPGVRWLALLDTPSGAPDVLRLAAALANSPAAPLLLTMPSAETTGAAQDDAAPAAPLQRVRLPESTQVPELLALLRTWNAQGLILAADSRFAHPAAVETLLTQGRCALLVAR